MIPTSEIATLLGAGVLAAESTRWRTLHDTLERKVRGIAHRAAHAVLAFASGTLAACLAAAGWRDGDDTATASAAATVFPILLQVAAMWDERRRFGQKGPTRNREITRGWVHVTATASAVALGAATGVLLEESGQGAAPLGRLVGIGIGSVLHTMAYAAAPWWVFGGRGASEDTARSGREEGVESEAAKQTESRRPAIDAAELMTRVRGNLSRYSESEERRTRVTGRLRQIDDIGNQIQILIDRIPGRPKTEIAGARLVRGAAGVDETLIGIGRNGNIEVVGTATASLDRLAHVTVHEVETINGRTLAEIADDKETGPRPAHQEVRYRRSGFNRYRSPPVDQELVVAGRIRDVCGTERHQLQILLDGIDGLEAHETCIATVEEPSEETERLLQRIGKADGSALPGTATGKRRRRRPYGSTGRRQSQRGTA